MCDRVIQLVTENGRRSIRRLVEPLLSQAGLRADPLGPFSVGGEPYHLPRFTCCSADSADPIHIGIFAAIHGDEPAGALATARFFLDAARDPELTRGFRLYGYPVCNPTGFEDNTRCSRSGKDLNREFWKASTQAEVQLLERELRTCPFHGIIQLHSDDTSAGVYGFVRGHTLTESLLRPALRQASTILPLNINAIIDGFAARDGIIYDQYDGVLAAPAEIRLVPFEIVFETPQLAPVELQVEALQVALRTILAEYRRLVAFAANI